MTQVLSAAQSRFSPDQFGGTMTMSVASNACTFAVKTKGGQDPSAASPVRFTFPTGSGGYEDIYVTAPLSIVIPSGATLGQVSSVGLRVWIAAFNDNGTVRLAVRNNSNYASLSGTITNPPEHLPLSSTLTPANSAHVFYTTGAAVTSKYWCWIAHADWESGLPSAGAWSANATILVLVSDKTPRPGSVIQSVMSGAVGASAVTSSTAVTDMSVGIGFNALSPCNLVTFEANGYIYLRTGAGSGQGTVNLYRDSTSLCGLSANLYTAASTDVITWWMLKAFDKPNTRSTVVYRPKSANVSAAGLIQYTSTGHMVQELMG